MLLKIRGNAETLNSIVTSLPQILGCAGSSLIHSINQQRPTFFAFPADIRRAIYTTNAIESMNMTLRKVLKNHRTFPTDEAALKVIYLAIDNISQKWTMPIRDWKLALNRFVIEFEGRFPE